MNSGPILPARQPAPDRPAAPAGRFGRVQGGAAGRECRELGRPRRHGPEAGQWAEVEEDAVELGQSLGREVDLVGKERERDGAWRWGFGGYSAGILVP